MCRFYLFHSFSIFDLFITNIIYYDYDNYSVHVKGTLKRKRMKNEESIKEKIKTKELRIKSMIIHLMKFRNANNCLMKTLNKSMDQPKNNVEIAFKLIIIQTNNHSNK